MIFSRFIQKHATRISKISYNTGVKDALTLMLTTLDAAVVVEEDPAETVADLRERLTDAIAHADKHVKEEGWG
mgnify:CR=1 FL=1